MAYDPLLDLVRETTAACGVPEQVTDPATVTRLATLLDDGRDEERQAPARPRHSKADAA